MCAGCSGENRHLYVIRRIKNPRVLGIQGGWRIDSSEPSCDTPGLSSIVSGPSAAPGCGVWRSDEPPGKEKSYGWAALDVVVMSCLVPVIRNIRRNNDDERRDPRDFEGAWSPVG